MKINAKVTFKDRKEAEGLICTLYDFMQLQKQKELELSGKVKVYYEGILPDDSYTPSQESPKEEMPQQPQQGALTVPAEEKSEVANSTIEAEDSVPVEGTANSEDSTKQSYSKAKTMKMWQDKLQSETAETGEGNVSIKKQVYEIIDTCELEEALEKLATFFEIKSEKQKSTFIEGIKAGVRIGTFTWTKIGAELSNNGITYNIANKNAIVSKITKKFKGTPEKISFSELTEYIVKKYSNKIEQAVPTEQEEVEEVASGVQEENTEEVVTPVAVEEETPEVTEQNATDSEETATIDVPTSTVTMECMAGITSFEEMLNSIDKSMTVEEKVQRVLEELGVQSSVLTQEEQEDMKKFLVKAMEMEVERISVIQIATELNLSDSDGFETALKLSSIINNYVRKHGKEEKVKAIEFCKQLKAAIFS